MVKLPPRRVLRSIVQDAIDDRQAFDDSTVAEETARTIEQYRALIVNLDQPGRALDEHDREVLKRACLHARIWREGYLDAWNHTGDKPVILEARQDIDRVTRTEEALGGRYMTALDRALETAEVVSIFDLRENRSFGGA